MALKLENCGENWKIIYSELSTGGKVLWDVSGKGEQFSVPADVVEIRKRCFDRVNCPNLRQVNIPERVRVIHKGAFDGFGSELEICCATQYKPEGFFEGEYVSEQQEDGSTYYMTHYGSWLRRSVVLRSRDSEGRLTWLSATPDSEISQRPVVRWGCTADLNTQH